MKTLFTQPDVEMCRAYARELSNGYFFVPMDDNCFSAACFNDNSIDELRQALSGAADSTDCENWNISATEWRESIERALAAKLIIDNDDQIPADLGEVIIVSNSKVCGPC